MNDQILNDISISFDIKNHRELTPYVFFTENSIYQETQDSYSNNFSRDFHHNPWINDIFQRIKAEIYSKKYSGEDQDEILNNEKMAAKALINIIGTSNSTSIEDQFSHLPNIITSQQSNLQSLIHNLKKKLIQDLRQMAISTARFPHYISQDLNDLHILQDIGIQTGDSQKEQIDKRQKDEEKMRAIISQNPSNDSQENDQPLNYTLSDLTEFYEIISQYKSPFQFSPSFIIFCIRKLDSFLSSMIDQSNKPSQNLEEEKAKIELNDQKQFNYFRNIESANLTNDEKQRKMNYFHLILKIKMMLYLMIHKTNEFLCLLMETIILEYDQDSVKQLMNEILPDTICRSKIVKNISPSEILDVSLSSDEENDYILTEEGLFKYAKTSVEKVEFEAIDELKKFTKSNTKIAYSNNVLFLVSNETKKIYKMLVRKPIEKVTKLNINEKKFIKKEKNNEEKKMTEKRLREKSKKMKKRQRRMGRKNVELDEVNNEPVSIDLSDSPIISVGAFDNCVRIIQKKNSDEKNGKTVFILTNVDFSPNKRLNLDIEEAFDTTFVDKQINQTKFEIEIQAKNGKYKVQDVCFIEDKIFFLFEDSTIQQYLIINNETAQLYKHTNSPYIISPNTIVKTDNDSFFYVIESISNTSEKAVSISKFDLPNTKYFLRSENAVFLKHPHLQKLSDIVDNCTHLIINRKVTENFLSEQYIASKDRDSDDDKKKSDEKRKIKFINPSKFIVSSHEMSICVQSISSLASQIEYIKELIENIQDEELKKFFIPLFIKICGINILYGTGIYYTMKDKMGESTINRFKKLKKFILDSFSLFGNPNSFDLKMVIFESLIVTFSLCGKFIFLPDNFDELHSIIHTIIDCDDNSRFLIRSFSFLIFSYPSSLYIIDDALYNELLKIDDDINLHQLFVNTLLFIKLEIRFARTIMDIDYIQKISPYIESLFKFINHCLSNESIPLIETEEILSYIIGIYTSNPIYSLMIEKELVGISENLFNRIRKVDGVLDNDRQFYLKNKDFATQKVNKVTKVFESQHPYNLTPPDNERIISDESENDTIVEELGVVDFDTDADCIFVMFDRRTEFQDGDFLAFYLKGDKYNPTILCDPSSLSFYQLLKYETNKIRITLSRKKKSKKPYWGYKMTFIGSTFDNPYYWLPNVHLNVYNQFISFLAQIHSLALRSTDFGENQKEFDLILKENIIQGIKLEDIDNYEQSLDNENKAPKPKEKTNKPIKRTLTRGISRGINYDTDNDATYDAQLKKSFIKDIITVNDESKTLGKQLLDILYAKTAKQNRIRLSKNNISILENEHYLAACLFKQLGLINVCIKFIKNVKINENSNDKYEGIEIPTRLQTLWKNIYSLRKTLFFEYQKSKTTSKGNEKNQKFTFSQYSEEIKRKCKLLLYSDPILKFKVSGNFSNKTIEESTKLIMKFVTSKTPISAISELIDNRRKKLSISSQSISLMKSFIDKKILFESSKIIFVDNYKSNYFYIERFQGVTYHELDDFKKLFGSLSYSAIKELYTDPTISIILCSGFLRNSVFQSEDHESMNQIAKFFIDVIEKNKQNKSFIKNRIEIISILVIFGVSAQTLNNELVDYLLTLLSNDDIDIKSKELILIIIPLFVQLMPGNKKVSDKSLAFSILTDYTKYPIIIRSAFYWIAFIFNSQKCRRSIGLSNTDNKNEYLQMNFEDFVTRVLKGIGQSFCGKSCLFIDDSFQSFTHRQVSEGMIQFIRLLVNAKNSAVLRVIDDTLIKSISKFRTKLSDVSEEELMIAIGLFTSLSQNLSALEPERYMSDNIHGYLNKPIIGFDPAIKGVNILNSSYRSSCMKLGFYSNLVSFDPKKLDLNEKEILIVLQLHRVISHSNYFCEKQNYEEINEREIEENILISSFYAFLPIILQNKNNAKLLLSNENIGRSLSLFQLATKTIPSNENSVLLLSHYLENAIFSPLYQTRTNDLNNRVDKKGGFRFMKASFGEIVYNDENDIVKADPDRKSLFICTRPFEFACKTYFEAKIKKIGMKRMFFGFVDAEACSIDEAFGFGSVGYDGIFCRKSPLLTSMIIFVGDKIMKNEQTPPNDESDDEYGDSENEENYLNDENKETNENNENVGNKETNENNENVGNNETNENIESEENDNSKENISNNAFSINEGDTIGCYYTPEFCYLTVNKKIIPYRLSHESIQSYVPLIFVDHDEIELEITHNLTKIDESNTEFDFLNIDNLPSDYFKEKDIQKSVKKDVYSYSNGHIKEKDFFIGQQVTISKIFCDESTCRNETIESYPRILLQYRENCAIIKDITPLNNSTFVSLMKLETYNNITLSKETLETEVDSRNLKKIHTTFFNLIENQTKTKFGFNSSYDLNNLPDDLKNGSDFNRIRSHLRNKTIKENSLSLAIIMCRYLSFILVDYLRYSKSTLLQDEGINSKEMNVIIRSLSFSIPTITAFKPKFFNKINLENDGKYLIFKDDVSEDGLEEKTADKNEFYMPIGFGKLFRKSFLLFLKKSEKFISKDFIFKLLQSLYENTKKEKNIPIDELYEMIPSKYKLESISPLPKKFDFNKKIDDRFYDKQTIVGLVPILVTPIPTQFPSAKVDNIRMRQSSNENSYFINVNDSYYLKLKWKADIDELKNLKFNANKSFNPSDYEDYKLKLGLFILPRYFDEKMLMNSSFGFIQTIFIIFQSFSNSNELYEKHKEMFQGEFINNLFSLASNKNVIALPFIQMIIASLISKSGFPRSLFDGNISNSFSIFTDNSNKLIKLVKYPNYKNELPLLFSIYSNLYQTRLLEISVDDKNEQKIGDLFDKYYELNKELFWIGRDFVSKKELKYSEGEKVENDRYYDDDDKKKKKKNFRSLYLVYYYSILLSNEMNIPYPKFLFAHDWIMQHFGAFRTTVSKEDIDDYVNKNNIQSENEDTIEYKTQIYENDFELLCSCKLFNIKEKDDDNYEDDEEYEDSDLDFNEEESQNENEEGNNENENDNDNNNDGKNEEESKNDDNNEKEKKNVDNNENENKNDDEQKKDKNDDKNSKKSKKKTQKEEKYKIFVHQLKDDSKVEIPSNGEEVVVSFPLEIIVIHEKGRFVSKNVLKPGDAFIIDFIPSELQQRELFLQHYLEIEKDFTEFVTLSKYDNELTERIFSDDTDEQTTSEPQPNDNNNDNNNNDNSDDDDDDDEKDVKLTRNDYKLYEIDQIPRNISTSFQTFTDRVVSLRHSTQITYRRLVEEIMGSYGLNDDDYEYDSKDFDNCYTSQIIRPAYSMKTAAKFRFIYKIMSNENVEDNSPTIVFNRFEQQKFMEKYTHHEKCTKYRPLFIQFMEQVEEDSIPILRNRQGNPFSVDLVGENAADAGGPGRELFSQLIEELMNFHIGVFTANPNNRHKINDVNKEDLIPNSRRDEIDDTEMNDDVLSIIPRRFIYAGALIACSIVSSLPQPLKLSMIIWEYLTREKVSIENVYDVDDNFHKMIQSAENLLLQISRDFNSISKETFEKVFPHNFQVDDSFDNKIELIPNGSNTKVTKENLHEFIELAKKVRCEEFKNELADLKEGFDKVMTFKNIVKILRPQELKLLVCGEPNCSIKLMKTMIEISGSYDDDVDKLTQIFWNVMESFSIEERMKFIRFSSGNLSLPAPGMKWEDNINVEVLSPGVEGKSGKDLAFANTCSSRVSIPYYDNENQLASILKKSIEYSGLITDSHENTDEVSEFM